MALFLVSQQWSFGPRQESPANWVAPVVVFFSTVVSFRLLHKQGWRKKLTILELTLITAIPVGIVSGTGWWQSPYVFILLASVVLSAYTVGLLTTMTLTSIIVVIVSVPYYFLGENSTGMQDQSRIVDSIRWGVLLGILAVTSSYANKVNSQNEDPLNETSKTIEDLKNVNKLLLELHGATQTMSLSFDEDDVVDSVFQRIKPLVNFNQSSVFFRQNREAPGERNATWNVVRKEGRTLAKHILTTDDLPVAVQDVLRQKNPLLLYPESDLGFSRHVTAGIYAPLISRGNLLGVLAVEKTDGSLFEEDDVRIVQSVADALGLAMDNARWFRMIKTIGADEERNRIARDLHDSLGQSLAYLLVSSEGLSMSPDEESSHSRLNDFSSEVRSVIGDMRDALYDLRTNVDSEKRLPEVISDYVERVAERSGINVSFHCHEEKQLSLLQEKEMWRIAQEAILNAEKHSQCQNIFVTWECNSKMAKLVVEDDGQGMSLGERRFDSYGILGMEERAEAIGATLTLESGEGAGCKLTCFWSFR